MVQPCHRILLGSVLLILAAGLGGCQSGGLDSTERPAPTVGQPGRTSAMSALGSAGAGGIPTSPLSAETLSVRVSRTLIYEAIGPDGRPVGDDALRVVIRDAPPDCHCAGRSWWVREYPSEAATHAAAGLRPEVPALTEARMIIDPSGYVAIAERIDRVERVEVVFSPALVVMPNNLPWAGPGAGAPTPGTNAGSATTPGASYAQELLMTVHPLGDRTRVKASGTARSTIVYVGDERVTTGAGAFTARKIVSRMTADLAPARVTNVNELWVVDGVGIVAEREQERTTVFGVPSRQNTLTKVLSTHVP